MDGPQQEHEDVDMKVKEEDEEQCVVKEEDQGETGVEQGHERQGN